MKWPNNLSMLRTLAILVLTAVLSPNANAAERCENWVAMSVSIEGSVLIQKVGETEYVPMAQGETLCPGDLIHVKLNSQASIVQRLERGIFNINRETYIQVMDPSRSESAWAKLIEGIVYFFSRTKRRINILTPYVNGVVEGTEFYVKVDHNQTQIIVYEGRVLAENDFGSVLLSKNQSVIARKGNAPIRHAMVSPRDAVRWSLYYPPVIEFRVKDFDLDTGWQRLIRRSIRLYNQGDLIGAFDAIENAPSNVPDPRYYTYRAGLSLTVGQIEDAERYNSEALSLDPANSHAFALKSVIAVVQNKKKEALDFANKAISLQSGSAAARVALSYALQSVFKLQKALSSLQQAASLDPDNSLVWSRLSELYLSVGHHKKALNAARKADALNPNLSHTQSVLGFAYLAQIKTKEAKAAFGKAIQLDQGAPLARLGLGLAKIREGDLKAGRSEIEIAAALDPGNSLIRSYLGKAYFEEKIDKHANTQFTLAKELDPMDPTPWFYDAIHKQTLNRPVEALYDLQKSIELNDNRAVYRSRLMLDEDLAARSASLSRIFADLGFEQLALAEGWKSLNSDPGSYSAHRFLADSYAALPRHHVARVSELLQSQLRQPANITPLQPNLAMSNQLFLEGTGPTDVSFSEFNPLFHRDRVSLQASGVIGEKDILGDAVAVSGVWGKLSGSIGQFHYETDGFRENNDLEQDIYSAFVQASLTHKTSIQAEYHNTEIAKGDLFIKFNRDDYIPNRRDKEDFDTLRFGIHHTVSPDFDLIASFQYEDRKEDVEISPVSFSLDMDGYSAEIQGLYRASTFSLVAGGGYLEVDRIDGTIIDLPPPFGSESVESRDIRQTNLYAYLYLDYPSTVTWSVGMGYKSYEGLYEEEDQFNPKLGVTWTPLPNTTLRAAVFRTLESTLVSHQTIEPTQVAGFNQFFVDGDSTESWRYGVAVDQKFSNQLFGGVELSWRDLEIPFMYTALPPNPPITEIRAADWGDDVFRAYLYWTPMTCLSFSAEYLLEQLDRHFTAPGLGDEIELDTHKLPIGIRYFHPMGFTARLKASYVSQKGDFRSLVMPPPPGFPYFQVVADEDDFWVVDASISYRLPRRFGILTFEAKNLFDETFKFQDTDPRNPRIASGSLVLAKLTLSF